MNASLRRIATEEGFTVPAVVEATRDYLTSRPDAEPSLTALRRFGPPDWPRLIDPDQRIRDMDRCGIDVQVLLLSSPGVQIFDASLAVDLAREVNDVAIEWSHRHPGRFAPLAAIAPQDPAAAAAELERAVGRGLHGAVVNSRTLGRYLDEPDFAPIFEAASALDVPIYLHPREPADGVVGDYAKWGLESAVWGYQAETSLHLLRLIVSGVFDRHPGLRMIVGHNGENIPFTLDRIDNRFIAGNGPERFGLRELPSHYLRHNVAITTSGSNWWPAVRLCIDVLGIERVMFAVDYPFEEEDAAVAAADAFPLSAAHRVAFFSGNAEREFAIAPAR